MSFLEQRNLLFTSPPCPTTRKALEDSEVLKFLLNSVAFKNFSTIAKAEGVGENSCHLSEDEVLDLLVELELWEAPEYIQEQFPYQFGGYDSQNRPIWMGHLGSCQLRQFIDRQEEYLLEKYGLQAGYKVIKSIVAKTVEENSSRSAVLIANSDGLSLFQFMYPPTLAFLLKLARVYKDIYAEVLGTGILVNANYVARFGINILRPILGQTLNKIEVYGHDEKTWRQRLREVFTIEIIPSFTGNNHDLCQFE
ncbi:unnamed protein product [Allacma fusca]|uniref:CRAL-TRIO domain-containing protein n=1 Tax=Allacma fusca TaxID=39272 RepID=A0A8J2KSP1_9HEXA|nr:unnamed protein product [Allacma fusca]